MTQNLMQRGASFLGSKLQTAAGRTVTIRQQQRVSAPITGWVASHQYQEVGGDGSVTVVVIDDWTFVSSDVVIGGEQIEPREGCEIVETLDGFENKYEVLPVQNRPCTEWLDTSGILLLVHSKRVGRAA